MLKPLFPGAVLEALGRVKAETEAPAVAMVVGDAVELDEIRLRPDDGKEEDAEEEEEDTPSFLPNVVALPTVFYGVGMESERVPGVHVGGDAWILKHAICAYFTSVLDV